MTFVAYLVLAGLLAATIANYIRLSQATARVESLYTMLYSFKYRIREIESEAKQSVDNLRYEINPAAAPQGGCGSGGCGSGGCGSHGHDEEHGHSHQAPASALLQIH